MQDPANLMTVLLQKRKFYVQFDGQFNDTENIRGERSTVRDRKRIMSFDGNKVLI